MALHRPSQIEQCLGRYAVILVHPAKKGQAGDTLPRPLHRLPSSDSLAAVM